MNSLFSLWKRGFQQWCSFNGRTSRPEFYAMLSLLLLAYLLPAVTIFASSMSEQEQSLYAAVLSLNREADTKGLVLLWIMKTWQSLVILMTLALGCRRLHDIGLSGWWQILLLFCISINDISYSPFFVLFPLAVWIMPTQDFPNKYGEVPSPGAPVQSPSRKSYIFTFIYLFISCGALTPATLPFSKGQPLFAKKPLSGWTSASIPAEHTYLLKGTTETFGSLFNNYRSSQDDKKTVYTIFRFIKNRPIAYGIVQEDGKKQYFISDNPNRLQQTLLWYIRIFIPASGTSSFMLADSPSNLSLNAKDNYNISCPVEELDRLLENYIKDENKNGKN